LRIPEEFRTALQLLDQRLEVTMPRDHRKLEVFAMADALAEQAYKLSAVFPKSEMFGMRAQLRRAAVSVASNLVEGCSRSSPAAFVHFVEIASGSAAEARYLMSLAVRLGFLNAAAAQQYDEQSDKLLRSLNRLAANAPRR
jgi:four helix bundle protein